MVVTPDNATLIVAQSFARRLTAFDIAADGSLSNRRLWADVTGDGICIDAEGAVSLPCFMKSFASCSAAAAIAGLQPGQARSRRGSRFLLTQPVSLGGGPGRRGHLVAPSDEDRNHPSSHHPVAPATKMRMSPSFRAMRLWRRGSRTGRDTRPSTGRHV